jgi:hypothetical protein
VAHVISRLGDAEVDELHAPVRGDEDVVWGHVAMDEAHRAAVVVGLLVGSVEAERRFAHDVCGEGPGKSRAALREAPHEPSQRVALEVLHHEVELAHVGDELEDPDHVRMTNARDRARLVLEHHAESLVLREVRQHALEHHHVLEAREPDETCEVRRGRASARELADDEVLADAVGYPGRGGVRCAHHAHGIGSWPPSQPWW